MKVIIVGAGEVGFHLSLRLGQEGHDVVVIDVDPARIREIQERMDVQTVSGLGSSPEVLEEAGVKSAHLVVAVTNSDEVNMIVCLFAKLLAPAATRVARIRNQVYLNYPGVFGHHLLDVASVINPEWESASQVDQFLALPVAASVNAFADGRVVVVGLRLEEACPFLGQTMAQLRSTQEQPFLIGAIERRGRALIPTGEDLLQAGDLVYLVSRDSVLDQVLAYFGARVEPLRSLVVVGGGIIGQVVADLAARRGIKTRLIESDAERCEQLAEALDKVMVLHGSGTDLALLQAENVGQADALAALTDHEEDNVLIALMAKQMGVKRAVTRVAHVGYLPLISGLGLDLVISPRLAAVSAILRYLRRGKVLSVAALKEEGAEFLEVEALETMGLVGRPLSEVRMPSGSLVVAVSRGEEVAIPSGRTVIRPGDRIVIFHLPQALRKLEKLLSVGLEYF